MKINCNKNIEQNKQNIESNANINKIKSKEGSKYFIQSPLNYTGSKFRLLSQLLSLFPTNIRNFVDLFCGGCNVGINMTHISHSISPFVPCEKIIFNDKSTLLIELLAFLKHTPLDRLECELFSIIESFHLSNTARHGYIYYNCDSSKGLASYNKSGFEALKASYNLDKSPLKTLCSAYL